jgi:predicted Ser/Thr protein kinase
MPGVAELRSGEWVAGYQIEQVAGRGGMGVVYRARQRRPDRVVAIKVISAQFRDDPDFRARFERECNLAAQIEHPNVLPVYEVGEHEDHLFIAMRFVDGEDLSALRRREGRIPPQHAARIITQVASALDAAHRNGLVHRDIKPGNMLLAGGADGHVYLTDFGLTKQLGDSKGMTATGAFVGTADYVAPEQVMGGRIDARADIYALGCVLYELLAGAVPFERESEVAKIFAHVHDEAPPLEEVAPDLPRELSQVVAKAMAKDPAARYFSAGDFAAAVNAALVGRLELGPGHSVAAGAAAPDGAPPGQTVPAPEPAAPTAAAAHPAAATVAGRAALIRRPWIIGGAVLAVAAVAGIAIAASGGGGSGNGSGGGSTAGAGVGAAAGAGGAGSVSGQGPARVVRNLYAEINHSREQRVAALFAVPATVEGQTLTTRADIASAFAAMPCGAMILSLAVHGHVVVVRELLRERPGSSCASYVGEINTATMSVVDGKIISWAHT